MFSFAGPPQEIRSGSLSTTFISSDGTGDFPNESFCAGGYLGPAESYMRIRRGIVTEEKVLLYLFPKPVHVVAENRCEELLFSPPHDTIGIMDPRLVGKLDGKGNLFLAGTSYTSMPVVISVPIGQDITGDGSTYFVVDKAVVDEANRLAREETEHALGRVLDDSSDGAELAFRVEQRLLRLTGKAIK